MQATRGADQGATQLHRSSDLFAERTGPREVQTAGQPGRPLLTREIAQFSPPLRLPGTLVCVIFPGVPVSFHDWVGCGGTPVESRGKRASAEEAEGENALLAMVGVPDTIRRRRLPERGAFGQVEGFGERE